MQYVKGVALDYAVKGTPFCLQFLRDKFGDETNALHTTGMLNCRVLGRVLALDVLTNNFDRLPCIWNNKGNAGNVLFQGDAGERNKYCLATSEPHTAIGIDNMVSCIDVAKFPKQHSEYVEKTSALLRGLLAHAFPTNEHDGGGGGGDTTEFAGFKRVREFLRDGTQDCGWPGTGFDIGVAGLEELQQGFLRCMAAFASIPKGELEDVKATLHEAFKDAITEHCTWGLERIHPEFILRIAAALHEVADESKFMDTVEGPEAAGEIAVDGGSGQSYVAEPDLALLPRSNSMHRRHQNRITSQKNLAALNGITSSTEIHVTSPFAMCGLEDPGAVADKVGQEEKVATPAVAAEGETGRQASPPRSPRTDEINTATVAATMASPALLRRLAQQQQDEKKSGVCVIS
jgi:hypothetical protein